jgi:hypothetical protein
MHKRSPPPTREELERIDPTEAREIEALRHNVRQLHRESQDFRALSAELTRRHDLMARSRGLRLARRLRGLRDRLSGTVST